MPLKASRHRLSRFFDRLPAAVPAKGAATLAAAAFELGRSPAFVKNQPSQATPLNLQAGADVVVRVPAEGNGLQQPLRRWANRARAAPKRVQPLPSPETSDRATRLPQGPLPLQARQKQRGRDPQLGIRPSGQGP